MRINKACPVSAASDCHLKTGIGLGGSVAATGDRSLFYLCEQFLI